MLSAEFETFWAAYPHKKARLDAMKAYTKARKLASATDILEGVSRYIHGKPEWQEWKYPAAWLRGGRWMDDYNSIPAPQKLDWFAECQRLHGGACGLSQMRHHTRKLLDGAV